MARRRTTNVFSLTFLDIMSCGFGAVILIYIVINHGTEVTGVKWDPQLQAEAQRIEQEIEAEKINQVELRNTLTLVDEQVETTQAAIEEKLQLIERLRQALEELTEQATNQTEARSSLEAALIELEVEIKDLETAVAASEQAGAALREIEGQGDRQYLTGLRMGGRRVLILLDQSASMLDETIVNVIRLRNLSESTRKSSPKWQRSLRTVEWITANMAPSSQFRIVTFNTEAKSVGPGDAWRWLEAKDETALDESLAALANLVPSGGSNLSGAFEAISKMEQAPDNIFLLTDGLPTQGDRPARGSNIDGQGRMRLFAEALDKLPLSVPVNVILLPMEGDPMASPSFWRLAQMTGGAFLSPPEDWP